MLYKEDPFLTTLFKLGIKSGIKYIESENGDFCIKITFNNNTKVVARNTVRYYGWISRGTFEYDEKKYQWSEARPSKKIMSQLLKSIKNFKL